MNLIQTFPYAAALALLLWSAGLTLFPKKRALGISLLTLGTLALGGILLAIWITLDRPPLRTLGETRLWYAFLLPIAAGCICIRWKMTWPLYYAIPLAGLFLGINLAHPESWDRTLMPALRSVLFVPHVLAYLLAYAFLSAAFAASIRGWRAAPLSNKSKQSLEFADRSVQIGFAFLTLGLCIGAVWAKEAWGHYWAWDPKETWALLTWLGYLGYLHFRLQHPLQARGAFLFLGAAWIVLLLCWFGLNHLPIADQSVHTYTR
ncbi:cytochrome c biogenesis protein CcsA [Pelagicoccus sp. SDUM812005]|uniref:cytochrome c biogenesis protein n=1 Tax=Pelagicoccus sp. SDUM812005 TaxID=3041257 RepID=UPI00280DD7F6|nr:cytochrome c biogenesis protein CcsA [Pelagicoccus sp. SDUM812005]MDQ8179335.1 cytochrome c biogenesis protein CcsA [Pelagicoccus sp. SDUM812005]